MRKLKKIREGEREKAKMTPKIKRIQILERGKF